MSIPVKYELNHFGEMNAEDVPAIIKKEDDNTYIVIRNNRKSTIKLIDFNPVKKTFKAKVNGITIEGAGFTELDMLIRDLGFNLAQNQAVNEINAPMPGLVLDIKIAEGDHVEEGATLLVLEAMKMENIIKSPGEGVVKTIHVQSTDSVEKGQLLIEFE